MTQQSMRPTETGEASGVTRASARFAIDPRVAATMGTEELRRNFLISDLFRPDRVTLSYTHYDRMIVGGAVPTDTPLALEPVKFTGTAGFLDRRELIAINIGGQGRVVADDESFVTGPRDMVYLGKGTGKVGFASEDPGKPARFYLISAPAHSSHSKRKIGIEDAKRIDLGSQETSNERSIFQFIHPEGASTCQLVVGITQIARGSVWNTMPCHVHDRRTEAYLYFGLDENARVFHFLGEPDETRHIVMKNEEAVLSPPWSIHSGAGTSNYSFIWAMAGDNVDYTDVDPVAIEAMR